MATRYWVGGAGTWDASTTTNWSASSGGAGGASAPTTADNVIFDANSGTGTVAFSGVCVCNDLTVTATQALSFGSGTLYGIYGSLSLPIGGSFTWAVPSTFRATTTGKTINWGDKTTTFAVGFAGTGGDWTFTSNATVGGITVSAGELKTNGYTVSLSAGTVTVSGTGVLTLGSSTVNAANFALTSGTPTINLGTATVNISGSSSSWNASSALTVTTGASTINLTAGSSTTFNGAGKTYYNLNFSGVGYGSYAHSISGANTFNNLSIAATSGTTGTLQLSFQANQVINGTFTTTGTTSSTFISFISNVAGTQRTLSVGTMGTFTYTKWQDMALTGAASPWTAPPNVLDTGNNSGIIFDSTTLYWVGGGGDWYNPAKWATSSGGTGGAGIPGATNSVVIDANSGTGTVTTTAYPSYCNDLTVSATQAISASGINYSIYGSLTLPSGGSFSLGGGSATFSATTTGKTINLNGKGFSYTVNFSGVGGEWTLQSNLSADSIGIYAGTLRTNGYTVSCSGFGLSGTLTKALYLGSSALNVIGFSNVATNTTFDAGTSTITVTDSERTFAGAGFTYYNVVLTAGSVLTGANTFTNLTCTAPASQSRRIVVYANQTITGTLTISGANGNQRLMVMPDVFGTQRTFTAAAVSLTDVDFYNITGAGAATWSGTRLGNGGQNVNITFPAPKTVYWNLAAGGDWLTSNAWATSSGGTPATTNYPLCQDTAIIENTGLNTSATISMGSTNAGVFISGVNMSTRTNAMTFSISQTNIHFANNVTLGSGTTVQFSTTVDFTNTTTFTSAGKTWPAIITINPGATLTTADAFTSSTSITNSGTLTLGANATFTTLALSGTTNLSTYTLTGTTCTLGAASTTNFGTGKIVLTGNAATIFTGNATQTVTGTPVVECNYSGATGTRTINPSTPTEANTISFKVTAGTDTFSNTAFTNIKDLDFTGFSGTLTNTGRSIYGNLTLSTGMTLTAGIQATTFAGTSGTKTITTNGKTLDFTMDFNGAGSTWVLADNFTQGSTRQFNLLNGTANLNGKTFTCGSFVIGTGLAKNLTFNGGTLAVTAVTTTAFYNTDAPNFTTTAGTGTGKISMTGATAKTFVGGGSTYNCTLENAGAGALTITGSNTFTTISNSVQPTSFLFTAGTTTTVTNFSVSGTSGNLVTIGSVTAASHTLSKSSGIVGVSYCSISRSTATGGATWQALTANGNVDGGNNSGWKFSLFNGNGLFFGSNF